MQYKLGVRVDRLHSTTNLNWAEILQFWNFGVRNLISTFVLRCKFAKSAKIALKFEKDLRKHLCMWVKWPKIGSITLKVSTHILYWLINVKRSKFKSKQGKGVVTIYWKLGLVNRPFTALNKCAYQIQHTKNLQNYKFSVQFKRFTFVLLCCVIQSSKWLNIMVLVLCVYS